MHPLGLLLLLRLLLVSIPPSTLGSELRERIRAHDEPQIVSWRVLEGVTEPFELDASVLPQWKMMKMLADTKAANLAIPQALADYGQLIRHSTLFGDMPLEERYDVFLSMSRLLKLMGFHQRAELLLLEAMSYTNAPYEAHYQLGLLAMDREDLDKAKVHLKNCLFFKEDDVLILTYLSVVLIAEGRTHEAKFFLGRILANLERRAQAMPALLRGGDMKSLSARADHALVSRWAEELILRSFHGDFAITPSGIGELFRMFSNLYVYLSEGQLDGRFEFDLGQSLYEGGRPVVGKMMMARGHAAANAAEEGFVSTQVVALRLALDYPVVPRSVADIYHAYLNITYFLAASAAVYEPIPLENLMDLHWPLPLLAWSGLPVAALLSELLWRFVPEPFPGSAHLSWMGVHGDQGVRRYGLDHSLTGPLRSAGRSNAGGAERGDGSGDGDGDGDAADEEAAARPDLGAGAGLDAASFSRDRRAVLGGRSVDLEEDGDGWREKGGGITPPRDAAAASAAEAAGGARARRRQRRRAAAEAVAHIRVGIIGGHMNTHPVGQAVLRLLSALRASSCHTTLFSLPLLTDAATALIAGLVDRVVNLPLSAAQAGAAVASYGIDVLLFPDWQPFPDQQALLYQQQRLAPVQVCVFVRGVSCPGQEMDFYLLPSALQASYLSDVPAVASSSALRPAWREAWPEQVVLVDYPVLTAGAVLAIGRAADGGGRAPGDGPPPDVDLDGQIFFSGQPVALLPLHPSQLHPLMDETLVKLLQACPSLQLVLALPAEYFAYGLTTGTRHKIVWARHLVRRLWDKAGGLYGRIRLLPGPVGPARMVQLAKMSDVVLDAFPIGVSFFYAALSLAVGTPVLSMRCGAVAATGLSDEASLQALLAGEVLRQQQRSSAVYRAALRGQVPWKASVGVVEAFYRSAGRGLWAGLVAHNASHYHALATALLSDRELGYRFRIAILDAVDAGDGNTTRDGERAGRDAVLFLQRLGAPWARLRLQEGGGGGGVAVI